LILLLINRATPRQAPITEELFRYQVFKMLKSEGKITDVVIDNMMNWPPVRKD
jgi:hypothetical protein